MQTPRRQARRNRRDAESAIAPAAAPAGDAEPAAAYLEPAAVQSRMIKIAEYAPHPRNYNRHPAAQIQAIAASLRTFGQPRPGAVWRSFYLAGHGVIEAAKSLGWSEARADVLPDDYPEHLALAYVAADNELVTDLRNAQRTTAIRVNAPTANDLHPTSKPTRLIRLTATNNTEAGALWIDPFAGSGSTLIAAEQAERRCYAMELDPGYCAVILQRYQEATGDRPALQEAGA